MLSRQAVEEFNDIFESEFGVRLLDDEAQCRANDFLTLFDLISKPIPETDGKVSENHS